MSSADPKTDKSDTDESSSADTDTDESDMDESSSADMVMDMDEFKHYSPSLINDHQRKYHVFLSFRGPDVRQTLVDHLFQSLSTAGLRVFLDSESLAKGENFETDLKEAIQNSTLHLPIFSQGYASSDSCLKEVSLMWASKSTCAGTSLIPLFYKVEPCHVRYPHNVKSPYAKALKKHSKKGRHSQKEMDGWKEALRQVSLLSGWSLERTANGYEGRLVKQVVMDIVRVFNINSLHVAKRPVGLKARMVEAINMLRLDDHRRLSVGIWGMGGLGKTTLSKAIYNQIHQQFDACCFVSDIRATAGESVKGLTNLQGQILRNLAEVNIELYSVDHGIVQMKTHLASKRALVILDDLDDKKQVEALVGDWYGAGSRIIITTRDKNVLKSGDVDNIYSMKGLDEHQSVELFSWHAFLRAFPEEEYANMTKRIVNACAGLPLSLEIIGAHLYDKRELRYWNEALDSIQIVGYEKVFQTLKVSYDSLTNEEQQIFLDIACFFVTLPFNLFNPPTIEFYIKFWKVVLDRETVYTSIKNLEEKSFIVVDDQPGGHPFSMHDHLRDFGREIVAKESRNGKRSRLWHRQDIHSHMDLPTEETSSVTGLMLNDESAHSYSMDSWASMCKLKFLMCCGVSFEEITMLPRNLRYLVLCECRFISLPRSIGELKCLKYLDMSHTKLVHLPNEVGKLPNLEELYLRYCSRLPQSFGNLTKLKVLDISCCENLDTLPSLPEGLVNLNAIGCNKLEEFSSMSHILKLETIDLSKCKSLTQLPQLNCMQSLRELKLVGCEKLEELPSLPESLVNLQVAYCDNLQRISSISALLKLETLDLYRCRSLSQLPQLDCMQSLRELNLPMQRYYNLQENSFKYRLEH